MKINVLFLYGGNSTEHEISIISAVQAMNNMDKDKYEVIPVYISKNSKMYYSKKLLDMNLYKDLKKLEKEAIEVVITKRKNEFVIVKNSFPFNIVKKFDFVFPVMHGYNTEDGCIAGFLEVLGAPYAESDIYASVLGQDKVFQKIILKDAGIPVVDYTYFYEKDYNQNPTEVIKNIEKLGYPVIVKPSRQGSSVGINVCKKKSELVKAIEDALSYEEKVLVEKVVSNLKELNCSVVGGNGIYEASLIEEVFASKDLLSYEDKYMSSGKSKGMASAGRKVPADISKKEEEIISSYSINACKTINTNGVVRIDYLMDMDSHKIYLNEMNIVPGSLSFYLWTPKDVKYSKLLDTIIQNGIKRYKLKKKKLSSFSTNVLSSFNGSKGVKK